MGTIGMTTTVLTPTLVSNTTINPDGTVNKKSRNEVSSTLIATTATLVTGEAINRHKTKEIHDRYAVNYIESMSDEELASALEYLDLLDASEKEKNKTI